MPSANTANKKIIHFDDSLILVNGIKKILLSHFPEADIKTFTQHQVFTAYVFNCLDKGEPIDLIITDFMHPGPNGYELAKAIRDYEQNFDRRTAILLLTIYEQIPGILLGLKENVFDKYISLQEDEGILLEYICSVLYQDK